MDFVLKVLRCETQIIESETIMTFLADDKVSDNEAIVHPSTYNSDVENCVNTVSDGLVKQGQRLSTSESRERS